MEKGIYPTDSFLRDSLDKKELFTLKNDDRLYGCVILNSRCNEGYADVQWSFHCNAEVLRKSSLCDILTKEYRGNEVLPK